MPFTKSSGGKKQAPMPGPNSAAYRKIVAAKSGGNGAKTKAAIGKRVPGKSGRKRPRNAARVFLAEVAADAGGTAEARDLGVGDGDQ